MIEGELINLRPVTREDLPLLQRWLNDREIMSRFNFFGYRSTESVLHAYEKDGYLSEERGRFMIVLKNDTLVGDVSYHTEHYGPGSFSRVYNMGIALIPDARGKGYGVEAQRLLYQYLFLTTAVERVEASTDVENIPEQRALEKAGFKRDGVMRHCQFREGGWRDLVVYSRLRGD